MSANLLRFSDRVRIINIDSRLLTHKKGQVVGIASAGIVDIYIVELDELCYGHGFSGFGPIKCVTLPEACLEKME